MNQCHRDLRVGLIALVVGTACTKESTKPQPPPRPILLESNRGSGESPPSYAVRLETTAGAIVIDVTRDWAPIGADRFYHLVKIGFYDGTAFFRVVPGFMAQAGLHGHPAVSAAWRGSGLSDDKVRQSNLPGYVSFASTGANGRTTQFFINLGDNSKFDKKGFAPFGKVRDMTAVEKLYGGYGDGPPSGRGPNQIRLYKLGSAYLSDDFEKLDYIVKATLLTE